MITHHHEGFMLDNGSYTARIYLDLTQVKQVMASLNVNADVGFSEFEVQDFFFCFARACVDKGHHVWRMHAIDTKLDVMTMTFNFYPHDEQDVFDHIDEFSPVAPVLLRHFLQASMHNTSIDANQFSKMLQSHLSYNHLENNLPLEKPNASPRRKI